MTGLGPARLTIRGLRLAPGVTAIIGLLVLVSVFLAVGAPRQTNGTLTDSLHQELASSSGSTALTTDLTPGPSYKSENKGLLTASLWPHVPSALATIHKRMSDLGDVVEPGEFVGNANGDGSGFVGSGTSTTPEIIKDPSFTIEAAPSLHDEARLVSGRWPGKVVSGKPIEVVIAAKAAATLRWKIGQEQTLSGTSATHDTVVVLVGTVAPRNPTTAFWNLSFDRAQLRTVVTKLGTVFYYGRVWVDPDSWPKLAPKLSGVDLSAWYGINLDAITADRATAVAAQVRRFVTDQSALAGDGSTSGLTFTSGLPADLIAFAGRSASSVALIALFELGPAGALAAVLLLGITLLQSRRSGVETLLRARGGSLWQLRMLAGAVVAVWTVPAAILGCVAAVLLTPGLGSVTTAILVAVLCALAPPVAAAVVAEQLGSRSRRSLAARAAGPVAEATIILLAALVLAVLVARGPVTASSRIDPLVELAPLLLALAVTVLVIRGLPFAIRWANAVLRRGRSAVSLVAASGTGLARRGGAWALFALVVGTGMSVFSLTMVATQQHGVHQAALSTVGSDVAVSGIDLSAGTVRRLEQLPGVAASATVQSIGVQSLPSSNFTIYTVDPKALASVQRGIDHSPLLAVHGDDTVVSNANNPPATVQLEATGQAVLRLHRVSPTTVSLVLADSDWMLIDRSKVPKSGEYPITVGVLMRLRAGADPAATAAAAQRVVGSGVTVSTAAHAEAAIVGSPVDRAVHLTILAATTLAIVLCLLVFVMTLVSGAAERLRRGAILRALGFDRRQTATLVLADIVPLAVIGVVVGALTGVGLAAVVLRTIDPSAFIGANIPIAFIVDVPTTALVLVGFLVAAILAVAIAVILDLRRPSTAGLLTLGEER